MNRDVIGLVPAALLGVTVGVAVEWLLPDQWAFVALVALAATLVFGIVAVLDDEEWNR